MTSSTCDTAAGDVSSAPIKLVFERGTQDGPMFSALSKLSQILLKFLL